MIFEFQIPGHYSTRIVAPTYDCAVPDFIERCRKSTGIDVMEYSEPNACGGNRKLIAHLLRLVNGQESYDEIAVIVS